MDVPFIKVSPTKKLKLSSGEAVCVFAVTCGYDIWRTFISNIDWIDHADLQKEDERFFDIEEIRI